MSKKTHQRELERARAKRQQEAYAARQRRMRIAGIVAIVLLAVVAFAVAALNGDDTPDVAVDEFGFDEGDDTTTDATPDPADGQDEGLDDPAASGEVCENPSAGAPESPRKTYDSPPEMTIDPDASYVATIDTTCGTVVIDLAAAEAPVTVNNFVFLASDGYYDGAPFHRVIDGFMIQGGDPSGTGHGEGGTFPGYTFEDELGLAEQLVAEQGGYPRGTVAMANSGPDTNGSQFFLVQAPDQPYPLPPDYAVFGQVIEGLDVIDRIALGPVTGDLATEPVRIISISIEES